MPNIVNPQVITDNYNIEKLTVNQFACIEIPEKIRQQLGINNQTKFSLKVEHDRLIPNPLIIN